MTNEQLQEISGKLGLWGGLELPELDQVESIQQLDDYELHAAFRITYTDELFKMILVSYNYSKEVIGNYESARVEKRRDFAFLGYVELKKDWGHVLIRPETLGDWITNIFTWQDVKFKQNRRFCKRFYITSTNEALLRKNITEQFMETVENEDGLLIEFAGKKLIFRVEGTANEATARRILNLGQRLSKLEL